MARCQICGKKATVGRVSRHRRGVASKKFAHRAPKKKKLFKPNLQKISFNVGGLKMTMVLCTSCIKKMRQKEAKEQAAAKAKTSQNKTALKISKVSVAKV